MKLPRIRMDLVAAAGTAKPVAPCCGYAAFALWAAHVSPYPGELVPQG